MIQASGGKRVLHVYKTYFPESYGGVEQVIFHLCRGTTKRGVVNRVFTLGKSSTPRHVVRPEAEVFSYPANFELASCPVSFRGLLEFHQHVAWADIIHYHFPWPFADFMHVVHGVTKPALATYHSDIIRQRRLLVLYRPLMKRFLSSMDYVVATSPNYVETSDVLADLKEKPCVVPLGLDKETYPRCSVATIEKWRGQYGDNFFLFVGVMRRYKGLRILLEAIRNAEHHTVIAGSGPIEAELRNHARDLGLKNVHFIGYVPDEEKSALLHLCRAVVCPSNQRSEAFGISLLEGAMYGKPLISSEIGTGTSYINIDGETGLVVQPNDPASLRDAMDRLYRDEPIALTMGKSAERRFRQYFTSDKMVDGYIRLYDCLQ